MKQGVQVLGRRYAGREQVEFCVVRPFQSSSTLRYGRLFDAYSRFFEIFREGQHSDARSVGACWPMTVCEARTSRDLVL